MIYPSLAEQLEGIDDLERLYRDYYVSAVAARRAGGEDTSECDALLERIDEQFAACRERLLALMEERD